MFIRDTEQNLIKKLLEGLTRGKTSKVGSVKNTRISCFI